MAIELGFTRRPEPRPYQKFAVIKSIHDFRGLSDRKNHRQTTNSEASNDNQGGFHQVDYVMMTMM